MEACFIKTQNRKCLLECQHYPIAECLQWISNFRKGQNGWDNKTGGDLTVALKVSIKWSDCIGLIFLSSL